MQCLGSNLIKIYFYSLYSNLNLRRVQNPESNDHSIDLQVTARLPRFYLLGCQKCLSTNQTRSDYLFIQTKKNSAKMAHSEYQGSSLSSDELISSIPSSCESKGVKSCTSCSIRGEGFELMYCSKNTLIFSKT